jgi:ATP-dependent exoDNAse (exonuclease V) beta subunit
MSSITRPAPPDQRQRERALDAGRSILVQAPAGSGKTDLLTRRFLRLLSEVDEPGRIVAITFTKAAAAEMRNRILSELEKAAAGDARTPADDEFSMEFLARRALQHSRALGWDLLNMPAQLRISTIDSFCYELALQQPLLSGLGGGLDITERPAELYRRAARRTLEQIGEGDGSASPGPAIEALLSWRDNGLQEMEDLLVKMLAARDRWMQEFWLRDFAEMREADWDALRASLERPFARAVADAVCELDQLIDEDMRDEAMDLARFSCGQRNKWQQCKLFQFAGLPCQPFRNPDALEEAFQGYLCMAQMLLTKDGNLCSPRSFNVTRGFPTESPDEKRRITNLVSRLDAIPGFEEKLNAISQLPPTRYPEDDWQIVRACFTLLRRAAAELMVEFAEAGVVDFTEVSQMAQRVLKGEDELPSEAALAVADGIHHLLVDEFQDTSRRQHKLIGSLVAAWPETEGRSIFVVGDPMQSIYFFRDADAELFPRVRHAGLELPTGETLKLDFVPLSSNFRTAPKLVDKLNETFRQIFAVRDGSGIELSEAQPAREPASDREPRFHLHVDFVPQTVRVYSSRPDEMQRKQEAAQVREMKHQAQTAEIVALIRSHMERIEAARARGQKYRIAVLGRTYKTLTPVAQALREAAIPFRAVDLESLCDRPEVLDALALARAVFNREDRVAWLGVLRAPWCGLSLADLHRLASADDAEVLRRPVPELLGSRLHLLSKEGREAAKRVLDTIETAAQLRAAQPAASLGTWLEQVWLRLGGAGCVDATGRANVDRLWECLDQLQYGEPDLLGRGLTGALEQLKAQPDPAAASDHGVQLMSIHKSKGLEFEVVIVPDLQAACGRNDFKLLSWLERGLEHTDDGGGITEFLVAPLPSKGAESGHAKKWVDRVYRQRESQETRRILYVAATRAREELHLFARPAYKVERDGSYTLPDPRGTLLQTAWPALEDEVRQRFEGWKNKPQGTQIAAIAAAHAGNLLVMPGPARPAVVRRLPADYCPPDTAFPASLEGESGAAALAGSQLYQRHEGGVLSRSLGSAVHALLEELARLRATSDWPSARLGLERKRSCITSQLRGTGVDEKQAARIAGQAMEIAINATHDANAQWILAPHACAASEVRWAGIIAGGLREVRVDRIFRAASAPGGEGDDCWWIIDYKTAHADRSEQTPVLADVLAQFRPLFASQLELYARVLRNLHGQGVAICAGLYYPRMTAFDWWQV